MRPSRRSLDHTSGEVAETATLRGNDALGGAGARCFYGSYGASLGCRGASLGCPGAGARCLYGSHGASLGCRGASLGCRGAAPEPAASTAATAPASDAAAPPAAAAAPEPAAPTAPTKFDGAAELWLLFFVSLRAHARRAKQERRPPRARRR